MTGIRTSTEDKIVVIINGIFLLLIFLVSFYPFYYIFINSLNQGMDAAMGGIYLLPRQFTFDNYREFLSDPKWLTASCVSVARTVIGTLITVLCTCVFAFSLSHKDLVFRKFYYVIIVFSMYFSGGLIPYYLLIKYLNFLDTFWVYVIPGAIDVFFIMIAASFFQGISPEIVESANIDGAGEIIIFFKIIIPVSMPLIATMLLFVGVGQWNAWLDSAYFVKSDHLRTLAYRMMEVVNTRFVPKDQLTAGVMNKNQSNVTSLSIQMAAMMISTLPIMCVYPFLQKHFAQGIMLGSVKG